MGIRIDGGFAFVLETFGKLTEIESILEDTYSSILDRTGPPFRKMKKTVSVLPFLIYTLIGNIKTTNQMLLCSLWTVK